MFFLLLVFLFLFLSSCHRTSDPLVGRWTVEKVNVEFDESKATPEMVRQYGELEKGNVIEINKDSTLIFISNGDTLRGVCSLKGAQIYLHGKPFGSLEEGKLKTESNSPVGKIVITYQQ